MKTSPIHIMHVLGNLGMGGAETGVVRLILAMEDDDIRHSIVILGSDQTLLETLGAEIPCHALNFRNRSYTAFMQLASLFRREQVDLVHVNNLAPWFDAALGAKLAGCRCIETFHGVEQGLMGFSFLKKMQFRGASLLTTRITAVAEEASDLFANLTWLARHSIKVIPNGIDTERFIPPVSDDEKRALRRAKGLPEGSLLFGCVAALRPVKNHSGLLRAFAQAVRSTSAATHLVLVGEGALSAELKTRATELGIAGQVVFLGRRTDVADLLQCFDAFVLNSDTEGLSYAVLEAMSSGLPLIGTAVGGNVKLVRGEQQGVLVAPGDDCALANALVQAVTTPDRLTTMGREARHLVAAEYGMATMVNHYRSLYRDLANA